MVVTKEASLGQTAVVDVAKVRAVLALLGAEAFLRFRPVLEARLAKLDALLRKGPATAAEALWLAHQCHGSALAMGLTQLARAFEGLEAQLRQDAAEPDVDAILELTHLHAVAWEVIAKEVPALTAF